MNLACRISNLLLTATALCCTVGSPAVADDAPQRRYDGRTISEWRARIGQLDFADPAIKDDVRGLITLVQDPDVQCHGLAGTGALSVWIEAGPALVDAVVGFVPGEQFG